MIRQRIPQLFLRPQQILLPALAPRSCRITTSRRISAESDGIASNARIGKPQDISSRPGNIPTISSDESKTKVSWPDGRETTFDNYFLFDHCRCPRCFHQQTKQRLKTMSEIPTDIHPTSVEVDKTGVHLTWSTSDLHKSSFPLEFLRRSAYDPPLASYRDEKESRILWNSQIAQSPPTVRYDEIMSTEKDGQTSGRAILKLLNRVHDFGFCFIHDVPATGEQTKEVIEKVAPIRNTHYGGFWQFTADLSHGDLAYSNEGLPAHTDTTYFTDPAGLQIFHLLSHPSPPGTGGTTLLVDGFYTASLLSTLYPTSYSLLSRLRVPAHASGTEGTMLRPPISQPSLRHDEKGQLVQVRWNNEDRGVLGQGWTPDEIKGWYQAARRYDELNRSEDAEYWVQLHPGTVLVIDNWRVMHGRSAFTGSRTMCGAYVGADDWLSRRAALTKKYEIRKKSILDEDWSLGW
ncbi:trimethyllysine dioxygenase [Kwoniella bestiolae CBS 10118]|uniref:trimethyllysine dioxygenase n=1 Tax=Kwoniella bestiolae CBS 10118 TaxID=1296100 RepID=A0A1B9G6S4_9TREE|nr:trimethyllysine dioxygenase [Kwoniella bestiolae CBS 10118]OCF26712.1 trimethyllysine dioxygenase [Kwoniella bestiolae CBS 10118]